MTRLREAVDANSRRHNVETWPEDARELYEERAGIREFDGGLPREEAEARAREDVIRYFREIKQREKEFWGHE
jgi:hypothetical protein